MPSNRPTAILADRARYAATRNPTPYRRTTTRAKASRTGAICLLTVGIRPGTTYTATQTADGGILLTPDSGNGTAPPC